ncbi:2,3-diphosphoglycerate-dependent phosphoglycerate mutase [Candidatus Falkowbacteria bacterium CG10_big_fil_rev_8_21_14_0_10_39_9]|uniref:2,3-bisphosphoglycerate-dependent phosphoglycerate mutase n=1 Tax=Candidatus Falkowbacteria bacterium CG10_big_fil_rev_8_21_14_0_10_39_9 TaxID=1974566 RepID=A0A2M6WQ76_9BACT|nr:MAG: 2,3-diphosphoglycerate-dependent phosphoglycerate mutase [Candidatus Falkowbacteria bacterium CG10_big_fil_rev_8_21_14_0_10_39_9]
MYKIVLLRHGQSTWNKFNEFTGWSDVDLSPLGRKEAGVAAIAFKKAKYSFDEVFQSELKRAQQTTKIVLTGMKHKKIPIINDWHLNERHYGNLQGMNKAMIREKYGDKQFMLWRRGYSVRPPQIKKSNFTYKEIYSNSVYRDIKIPLSESLADVIKRVIPFWKKTIAPEIKAGKRILISAHGNSLRALVKYLDKISVKEIEELNLPTGVPLVYELDNDLKPLKHYYLGDQKKIQAAIDGVKNQGKK